MAHNLCLLVFRDLLVTVMEEKPLSYHLGPMTFSLEGLYHTKKHFKSIKKDGLTLQDSC